MLLRLIIITTNHKAKHFQVKGIVYTSSPSTWLLLYFVNRNRIEVKPHSLNMITRLQFQFLDEVAPWGLGQNTLFCIGPVWSAVNKWRCNGLGSHPRQVEVSWSVIGFGKMGKLTVWVPGVKAVMPRLCCWWWLWKGKLTSGRFDLRNFTSFMKYSKVPTPNFFFQYFLYSLYANLKSH